MNNMEAIDFVRSALDGYGEGFSIRSVFRHAELQCEVEHGKTTGVRLQSEQCKLVVSFRFYNQELLGPDPPFADPGIAISMVAEGTSWDTCAESAVATVTILLKKTTEEP